MDEWKKRWLGFVSIVVDPWTIVLLATTVYFAIVLNDVDETTVATALTVVVSVLSAVLGGLLTVRWTQIVDERTTVTRGKVAIRSLKLLLAGIAALDRRVRVYLERCQSDDGGPSGELVSTYLEEVIGRCEVLEEETLSSIENWTDIVPEADIRTQIGVITELREDVARSSADLEALRGELNEAKGQSAEREAHLKTSIAAKEAELRNVRRELTERRKEFGSFMTASGGAYATTGMLSSSITTGIPREALTIPGSQGGQCKSCRYALGPMVGPGAECPRCGTPQ